MLKFISKLFGGSKSEKDVQVLMPIVQKTNVFFQQYQALSNDQLRAKTTEFKNRIQQHLASIDADINAKKAEADALQAADIHNKDLINTINS